MKTLGRWKYDEEINPYTTPKGMMFDLEAVNDVTVYGVDLGVYFPNSVGVVEVYITTLSNSTYVGNEEDPTKWTKIHNSSVTWKYNVVGAKVPLQTPFRMKANTKRGVYVTFTDNLALVTSPSLGSEIGNVVAETEDLKLLEGTMNSYPFGKFPIGPKIFFGRMRYFVTHSCSSAAECDDNIDSTEDACNQGQCQNNPIPGVCGNGICEVLFNEYCSTCPLDCNNDPTACGQLDDGLSSGGISYSGSVRGIVFTTKADTDLTIYEINAAVITSAAHTLKLYSKMGVFNGESDLNYWDLLFNGTIETHCIDPDETRNYCGRYGIKIPISTTRPVSIPAGSYRTFYLAISSTYMLLDSGYAEGAIVYQNDDLEVFAGTTIKGDLTDIHQNGMKFRGSFDYDYGIFEWKCTSSSECHDFKSFTTDECVDNVCQNNPIPGICGNGICEVWQNEYCSTCPLDCNNDPTACGQLDDGLSSGGISYSGSVRGIVFTTKADTDLTIYEINAAVITSAAHTLKLYSKMGVFNGESDLNYWDLLFNGTIETHCIDPDETRNYCGRYGIKIPISTTRPVSIPAGSYRTFYLAISSTYMLLDSGYAEGAIVYQNDDLEVFAGTTIKGDLTDIHQNGMKFRGSFDYDYGIFEWKCTSSSECHDFKSFTTDECVDNVCQNNPIPGICGNGICEVWQNEYCSTCAADCIAPEFCSEIQNQIENSYSTASNVHGIAFDIEALRSLSIYRIAVGVDYINAVDAKVYTKEGSYDTDTSSLDGWTEIFDETVLVSDGFITIHLNEQLATEQGSKRAFYVTFSSGSRLKLYGGKAEGSILEDDENIKVYAGKAYGSTFGNPTGSDFKEFLGGIKYEFTEPVLQVSDNVTVVAKTVTMLLNTDLDACFLDASQQDAFCEAWLQNFYDKAWSIGLFDRTTFTATCTIVSQTSSNPNCNGSGRRFLREGRKDRMLNESTDTTTAVLTVEAETVTTSVLAVDEVALETARVNVVESETFVQSVVESLANDANSVIVTVTSVPTQTDTSGGGGGGKFIIQNSSHKTTFQFC